MTARVAVVAFAYYPRDPRVRREAEALIEAGFSVDVICLRQPAELQKDVVGGVQVYRLPFQHKRAGRLYYLRAYASFICLAFFTLSILYMRRRYEVIHVHNMPDALVFSALLPRFCGSKIVLDLHDPMPEVYLSKYSVTRTHPVIRLLRLMEKYSIRFSDVVLTVNSACRDLFICRGCPASKIHVVMNLPQESVYSPPSCFRLLPRLATSVAAAGKKAGGRPNPALIAPQIRRLLAQQRQLVRGGFVVMYHGTIIQRNGLAVALDALQRLRGRIPNLLFEVYGDGDFVKPFLEMARTRHLEQVINYHGFVGPERIAAAIRSADVGLIPNIPTVHWEYATPTRMFEYLYLGKPVIVPRTKAILDCFDEEAVLFFESGNADSLANVLLEAYANPVKAQAVSEKGSSICYQKYRWATQKQHFVDIMRTLMKGVTTRDR